MLSATFCAVIVSDGRVTFYRRVVQKSTIASIYSLGLAAVRHKLELGEDYQTGWQAYKSTVQIMACEADVCTPYSVDVGESEWSESQTAVNVDTCRT